MPRQSFRKTTTTNLGGGQCPTLSGEGPESTPDGLSLEIKDPLALVVRGYGSTLMTVNDKADFSGS
jgi:hypothetical protein